jgi:UDP-glucose 4-epimerase
VNSSTPSHEAHQLSVPIRLTRSPRYLVTGGRGFIGAHLVQRLVAYGVEVHAVTRATPPSGPGVSWWQVDLVDPSTTQRVVREVRPDVVIHLAGRVAGTRDLEAVVPMMNDNVLSTVNLMTAATAVPGCKLVLAGSVEEPRSLQLGQGAHSSYAASKAASTTYATLFRDLWGLPLVVLRLAMVYGPGDPHTGRLVPHAITSLLSGTEPSLGSGRRMVDWVYIDDVVDALVAASVEPAAVGMVMDIGTGTPVSIHDFVSKITDVMKPKRSAASGRISHEAEDRTHIADPEPAKKYLNWRPRVDLEAGIQATVDWYRRHHPVLEPVV